MDQLFCCFVPRKKKEYRRIGIEEESLNEPLQITSLSDEVDAPIDYTANNSAYAPPNKLKPTPFDFTSNLQPEKDTATIITPDKRYRVILPLGVDVRQESDPLSEIITHIECGVFLDVLEISMDVAKVNLHSVSTTRFVDKIPLEYRSHVTEKKTGWIPLKNSIGQASLVEESNTRFLYNWKVDEVCSWLVSIQFGTLQNRFIELDVDGFNLCNLTLGGLLEHPFNLNQSDAERLLAQIRKLSPNDNFLEDENLDPFGIKITKNIKENYDDISAVIEPQPLLQTG